MCQALAKPLRIINFESYIGYVGFGSHNLTHVLFDLRALYTLLDSCQLDAGAKVPLETPIALFITGILGPQGEGRGFLCLNNVPLSNAGSPYRVQQVPGIEEKERDFRFLRDHTGKQPCR